MWSPLRNAKSQCHEFQVRLEETAEILPDAKEPAELLAALPQEQQSHAAACENCRTASEELLLTRGLLRDFPSRANLAGPWFASRVMAAIAVRHSNLRSAESAWTAIPRLASRLTWVSAALLLLASTWLFERPVQPPTEANQETLFENSQPPAGQDDVLVSLAERQQ